MWSCKMNAATSWRPDLGALGDICLLDASSVLGPVLGTSAKSNEWKQRSHSRDSSMVGVEWGSDYAEALEV